MSVIKFKDPATGEWMVLPVSSGGGSDFPITVVTDYGARGDGRTDDTLAFQTALTANRVVFVPGGTYILSDTLTIGANCCLELSQDTVLKFTQTSGNAIVMHGSATLRGNHAILSVPYAFSGNAVAMDTNLETDTIIPPYVKVGSHMFKRQRFVYDLNIIKLTSDGFCRSSNGKCNGTAVYMSATSTAESHMWMWAVSMSGIRIAGAFNYGIRAVNYDSPVGSSGHYTDDAWNHDMRIEAVIEGCEIGVSLENCNTAHLAVTVQPGTAMDGTKYAKHGFYISDSKFTDMIGSRVWDWNEKTSLWTAGGEYQHIALIGDCRGLILDDFLVHATSTDIKELIYTDTESNFDKMTILQEPGSKYFKAVNGEPYFDDGDPQRLAMKSDIDEYFTTERVPGFIDALTSAIDKNGNIVGYDKYGGAMDSNGNLIDGTETWYGNTGFITCKYGDTIYIQDITLTEGDGYTKAFAYDANFNLLGQNNTAAIIAGTTVGVFTGTATENGCTLTPVKADTAYIRLGFQNKLMGTDPIISVNEEIKFVQEGFLTDGIKVKAENIYGDVGGGGCGVYYIEGIGDTAGTWLGTNADITEYYPGLTVLYKVPVAGASTTTLNINNIGAVTVVRNATTSISTTCPVNSVVMLTYTEDSGTAYWKRADYDTNTKTSAGTSNKTDTKMYLVGAPSQSSSGVTTYSNTGCYIGTDNRIYSNGAVVPNTDEINALIDTKLAAISNAEEVAF